MKRVYYPGATKIIWDTLPSHTREAMERKSKESYRKSGLTTHEEIDYNELLNLGKPQFKEKFFVSHEYKYCGRVDFFSRTNCLVELKTTNKLNYIELKLHRAALQLGAYYEFVKNYKDVTGEIIFLKVDTKETIRFPFDIDSLELYRLEFLERVKEYYQNANI